MSTDEYTPTTEVVRTNYARRGRFGEVHPEWLAAFDRWLAERDRQVAEQALRDAAEYVVQMEFGTDRLAFANAHQDVADWLRARADSAAPAPCPECGPGYRYGDDGCRRTPAAAPDEREALDRDALVEAVVEAIWPVGEPEGPWPRREGIYSVAERVIALAARPGVSAATTPAVSAEAWDDALADIFALVTAWREAADRRSGGALEKRIEADFYRSRADDLEDVLVNTRNPYRTVADAPAADDEGGQER